MTVLEVLHILVILAAIFGLTYIKRDGRKQAAKQAREKVDQNTQGKQK